LAVERTNGLEAAVGLAACLAIMAKKKTKEGKAGRKKRKGGRDRIEEGSWRAVFRL
jgi:hypothetical protein